MTIFSKLFGMNSRSSTGSYQDKLAFLEVDMHNHILPGIDDGADNMLQSFQLLRGLQAFGFKKCICTPHMQDLENNSFIRKVDQSHSSLVNYIQAQDLSMHVYCAFEYLINESFYHFLKSDCLRPLPGGYILIEQDYAEESSHLFQVIERIQQLGLKPALAHPERYAYYHADISFYNKLRDAGCLFQLNLLSSSSYYGSSIKKTAAHLMKRGMYDLVGTDVHHERHILALQEVLNKYNVQSLLRNCSIRNASLQDYINS